MLREALMYSYGDYSLVHLSGEEHEFIKKFSLFIHFGNAENIINEVGQAQSHVERNAHPKILFMDLTLKLNGLLNIKNNHSTFQALKS
jgi:DNA polymerase-3 subunit delta'